MIADINRWVLLAALAGGQTAMGPPRRMPSRLTG